MKRNRSFIVLALAAVFTAGCGKRVPEPSNVAPGSPSVSWVIMSGDGDNPDREFVCQSNPRNDCVVPVSRPGAEVFSAVYFYYHGAGAETMYTGSIQIGFFQGGAESHNIQANIAVQKPGSIANQSVTGVVTSTPGSYAIVFALGATVTDTGKSQPLREQVPIVVK